MIIQLTLISLERASPLLFYHIFPGFFQRDSVVQNALQSCRLCRQRRWVKRVQTKGQSFLVLLEGKCEWIFMIGGCIPAVSCLPNERVAMKFKWTNQRLPFSICSRVNQKFHRNFIFSGNGAIPEQFCPYSTGNFGAIYIFLNMQMRCQPRDHRILPAFQFSYLFSPEYQL